MRKHPHNSSEPFWTVLNRSWGEVLVAKWNKVQPEVQPKVGTNPMSQNQKGESWLSLLGQISKSALRSSQHVRCAQAPWPPLLAPANRPNPNDQRNSPSLSYIPRTTSQWKRSLEAKAVSCQRWRMIEKSKFWDNHRLKIRIVIAHKQASASNQCQLSSQYPAKKSHWKMNIFLPMRRSMFYRRATPSSILACSLQLWINPEGDQIPGNAPWWIGPYSKLSLS